MDGGARTHHEYKDALAHGVARGRGAGLNPSNRFEKHSLHVLGEHLDELRLERDEEDGPEQARVPTRVFIDHSKTVINHVDSPDVGMEWTINPYRGCEHGCIYCYARPTHETFGMSSGLDFESKIFAKIDAPKLLRKELAKKSWHGAPIVMSGITDSYQPIERKLRITRGCLEVMAECGQPVGIITKNVLVLRDLDLLSAMAAKNTATVAVSLTTLDVELARKMEPRAAAPKERLRAMRELSKAGVPVIVMSAPMVPGLNDGEMPRILEAAAEAGATSAGYTVVRLPYAIDDLFVDWLRREYPLRAPKVLSLLKSVRGGKLNDPRFGSRMRGEGEYAEQIRVTFKMFKKRFGLDRGRGGLTSEHFRRPTVIEEGQMGLFAS